MADPLFEFLKGRRKTREPLPFKQTRRDELARVPYEQREGSGGGGHADLLKMLKGAYEFTPAADPVDVYEAVKDPSLMNVGIAGLAMLGGPPGDFAKTLLKAKRAATAAKKPITIALDAKGYATGPKETLRGVPFTDAAKGILPDDTLKAIRKANPDLKLDFHTKEDFIKQFKSTGGEISSDIKGNKIVFSAGSTPNTLAHEVAHSLIETDTIMRQTPVWQQFVEKANAQDEMAQFWGTAEQKLNRFSDNPADVRNYNWQETQADIVAKYIDGTLSPKLTTAVESIAKSFPSSRLGKFVTAKTQP